jgi:ABC-type lipopolysaccharide export system ATPase subunit
MTVLAVSHLRKRYRGTDVVNGLGLEVQAGE